MSTGLFIYSKTDLVVNDILPISLIRTYRQLDDGGPRAFGIGFTQPYDIFLWNPSAGFSEMNLVLPDGLRIHYVRTSPGTDYATAVLQAAETPGEFFKSTIKWNGLGWDLTLKGGTVYAFGQNTLLQLVRDRLGNKISIVRDGAGNITQINSPNNRWLQFTYDTNNHILQARDNFGRTVTYTYDTTGRLSSVTDANGGITTYTYDGSGNMLTTKDPRGIIFLTNQYDIQNRIIKQTQADNSTFQFAYTTDANGQNTQTDLTDPRGNVRRITFDVRGYMLNDTRALGKTEQQTTTYNRQAATNLLVSVTDALNRQTAYTYDAIGNVSSVTRLASTPNAVTTTFTYEPAFNQLATIKDPLNHTTSFAYESTGNLTAVTDPLLHQTTFTYNVAGQPETVTDPLQHITRFVYDTGDLIAITDPLNRTTNRFLDAAGRLLGLANPLGQTSRFEYDALNQVTRSTDSLGGQTSFSYDPNGNLLSVTDARGNATSYTYDNMDRLATRKDSLLKVDSYQYDLAGNLTQITDRRGKVTTFIYDALNRRTFAGFGTVLPGPTYESSISYSYDKGNRLTQVVDSISGTITPNYDNLDRLSSEATPQGTVSYAYDAAGRRTSMTVAGQPVVNYTFDDANRLTRITQATSTVSFGYDNGNRRTSLTLPNSVVITYDYDVASELSGISYKLGATTLGNLTYGYDVASRRTSVGGSFARTNLPLAVSISSYNANNQLTAWGTANLFYDANGNMTSDGTNGYTWDARNRLVSTLSGASFRYDPFGRRVSKTVGGATTNYLYDGANVAQELSGATPTANLLAGGVDELLTRTDSAGARHFLTDALGSTLALADTTGALPTQYTYDPFGNTTLTGSPTTNSFAYTGREFDATGLYYYRARYYNPSLQRFLSEDPVGIMGGMNIYAYVGNGAPNNTDAAGLWSPGAHDVLVQHALGGYATLSDIAALQAGSRAFDRSTQTIAYSNEHAMAMPGQSSAAATAATEAFINAMIALAQNAAAAGDRATALDYLAKAMHPIMDSSSPAHTDENGNPRTYCGFRCDLTQGHSMDWVPFGRERVSDLTDAIMADQDRRLRDAYDRVFGPRSTAGRKR